MLRGGSGRASSVCVRERDIYVISVDLRLGLAHGHAPARQLVRGNAMAIARPLGQSGRSS